jgi:hypothetical protein
MEHDDLDYHHWGHLTFNLDGGGNNITNRAEVNDVLAELSNCINQVIKKSNKPKKKITGPIYGSTKGKIHIRSML